MKPEEIDQARDPNLKTALPALQRAAQAARDLAIQTNTAIVIMREGKIVRITADELKQQREVEQR